MTPSPSFWIGKRVCVTGGTGFLGRHLVRQLVELGARVSILALPPRNPIDLPTDVRFVPGDIMNPLIVQNALIDSQIVFHTAGFVAMAGPARREMHRVHVEGTRNVLRSAPSECRIVHTSSIVAVGATRSPKCRFHEESEFPKHLLRLEYARSKRESELEAIAASKLGRDVVVVNPGHLIGPDDDEPSVMGQVCSRFWRGRLPLCPIGGLNLVDVRDVAEGHLLAAEHGRIGRRYILGGENRSWSAFLSKLAETAGVRQLIRIPFPFPAFWSLAAASHLRGWIRGKLPYPSFEQVRLNRYYWFYETDRAATELGYRTRPLEESLHDTWRWFIDRSPMKPRWWLRPAA